jgi:Flp pilus assembly protein TadG
MKLIKLRSPQKVRATGQRAGWRSFCDNRSGAALLEFAFLTPILMLLVTGIIQFGSLFFLENNMTNVARDAVRRLAVGDLDANSSCTTEESFATEESLLTSYGLDNDGPVGECKSGAEAFIQASLVNWGATFTVNVTEPDPADPNNNDFVVQISVPMADASIVDPFGFVESGTLSAQSTMRQEN